MRVLIGVLLLVVVAGGWQAAKPRGWEYAVVEVGSVSQGTSNVFFLQPDGYTPIVVSAGQRSEQRNENVSSNTDLRLRMTGKALSMLGAQGWELVGTGPPVADNPYMTYYLKRAK